MTKAGMTNDEISLQDERDELAFWGEEGADADMLLHDGPTEKVYDLEERTARFGEAIIRFAMKIPRNPVNDRLISQLVGAATSVGANYCEADDSVSRKDFRKSIGTCKKEARETKHFLRMIAIANGHLKSEARTLWKEARELHLIFSAIWRRTIPD